jgi:hypothetical protein
MRSVISIFAVCVFSGIIAAVIAPTVPAVSRDLCQWASGFMPSVGPICSSVTSFMPPSSQVVRNSPNCISREDLTSILSYSEALSSLSVGGFPSQHVQSQLETIYNPGECIRLERALRAACDAYRGAYQDLAHDPRHAANCASVGVATARTR